MPRGRTRDEVNEKQAQIAPDIGRYEPHFFAGMPKSTWTLNYQDYHVADVQGPCFDKEVHDYTDSIGCNKHVSKQMNHESKKI